jgi:hypothetical protein
VLFFVVKTSSSRDIRVTYHHVIGWHKTQCMSDDISVNLAVCVGIMYYHIRGRHETKYTRNHKWRA